MPPLRRACVLSQMWCVNIAMSMHAPCWRRPARRRRDWLIMCQFCNAFCITQRKEAKTPESSNKVALRVHRDEAKAAGKRFVLGHREVFTGHVRGQACGFVLVVDDYRFFNPAVDLLLRPIGSRDKAVKSCQ